MLYPSLSFRSSSWTPKDIDTALWLDASDAATITIESGKINEWRDKSGNDRNVYKASVGPTLSTFNGLDALSFNGTSTFLESTGSITTGTYTGNFNAYWVATRNGNGGAIITERSSALVCVSQWLDISGVYYISSNGVNNSTNHTIALADYGLIDSSGGIVSHLHVSGSRDVLFANGNTVSVTNGTASDISGATNHFRIGIREGGILQYWNGLICEIIISLNNQTTDERQRIEGFLAHKWGLTDKLPIDHPYKTQAP